MISRYLVIVLAIGAMTLRLQQGAWLEATGLGALAIGLLMLRLAATRPVLKPVAWAAFAVTAVVMLIALVRMNAP